MLGPLERANLSHWFDISKGPNRVGVSSSLEGGNRSNFRNGPFFKSTGRWTKSKEPVVMHSE
jgi:hypothetical protein